MINVRIEDKLYCYKYFVIELTLMEETIKH